ncbi:single stranded DNA-binding protein [Synechococcus sp. PCC 7502]|uniref:single-stranded DNA-binding protein n=1 Tax=Synechococcus sp. PCC 7502 TaxID=1173263 RepID=UPI00029F9A76|nr:single-stranded DNA-binding protein [Synechococcus sp. PCC 7502]AFY75378.1 single stranded DNA-binding protein [Synechococcus sp. PCC 7502]
MSINRVNLVGRAGRDPEVKNFDSGKQVCNFTLAVNRRTSNKDEPPDWFDLELWDKTADVAGRYVRKGSLIGVTGSLVFDRWKDKTTGEDRTKPVIRVDQLELLGSKQDNQPSSSSSYDSDF